LQRDFGPRLGALTCADIAARDPTGQLPLAFGVDALLSAWVDSSRPPAIGAGPSLTSLDREFDRLLLRPPLETAV
jgi:hypothetical protein